MEGQDNVICLHEDGIDTVVALNGKFVDGWTLCLRIMGSLELKKHNWQRDRFIIIFLWF